MGKARGGLDLAVGAIAVLVVGWLALKAVGFIFSAVVFGLKLLIAVAVVGVGLKVLSGVFERRELRESRSAGRLNS